MKIWRITSRKHIETVFSGVGGLYASGRWHPQGYKISYTSASLALASLERKNVKRLSGMYDEVSHTLFQIAIN